MVTAYPQSVRQHSRGIIALHVLAIFAATLVIGTCYALDAHLELPDPLIPGIQLQASVVVNDAQSDVQDIVLPIVPGVIWTITGRNSSVSSVNGAVTRSYTASIAMRITTSAAINFPP